MASADQADTSCAAVFVQLERQVDLYKALASTLGAVNQIVGSQKTCPLSGR
jgi:hypothetical protein